MQYTALNYATLLLVTILHGIVIRQAHLPDPQIHVIAAREDVAGIPAEADGKDTLHALSVVHLTAVASIVRKDTH